MKCNRCGSEHVFLRSSGNNVGIYCGDCGKWIKWATKDEIRVIEYKQAEIANNRTTSEQKTAEKYKEIEKIVNSPDYYSLQHALETLDKIAEVVKG